MFHHIEVSNFRALSKFRMEHLGRINLLVGTNNCGKTSVLEAISILVDRGSTGALRHSLVKRGEMHDDAEFELEHLFYGHHVGLGATFTIDGRNQGGGRRVVARVVESEREASTSHIRKRVSEKLDAVLGPFELALDWLRDGTRLEEVRVPITKRGGFLVAHPEPPGPQEDNPALLFLTTEPPTPEQMSSLLGETMLTPEEDIVLAALRTIEPDIERITPVGPAGKSFGVSRRGGVAVKLAGQRVPIGSLGDGIWRLLGIALALVEASGGVLLVDEIDIGLHYSVLEKMWRLVYETAKRLDVQVFATTHSRDCYESLAAIAHPTGHDVTVQRIERGKPLAVAFSEAEILQAAKRGIEVR